MNMYQFRQLYLMDMSLSGDEMESLINILNKTEVLVNQNKTVTAHFQKLGVFEDSVMLEWLVE